MKKSVMTILLSMALARAGAAQSIDVAKVRNAVELPQIEIRLQFEFLMQDGADNALDPKTRLANLQKTLRGEPDDAATYVKIARIYKYAPFEDTKQRDASYDKAISLFRKQLESHPEDGWIMAQLGKCLSDIGHRDEAEKMLRAAVQASPKDWRTWDSLGSFVQDQMAPSLDGGKPFHFEFGDILTLREKLEPFLQQPGLADKVERMQAAAIEAHGDFDRAIALAPNVSEPYQDRALYMWLEQNITQNVIHVVKGEMPTFSLVMSPASMDDLWRAADLNPDDPTSQSMAYFAEFSRLGALGLETLRPGEPGLLNRVPEQSRIRLRTLVERLQKAVEGNDRKNAKVAGVLLLQIDYFIGEPERMEQLAKRMLTWNPADKEAWDALCGYYVSQKKSDELAVAIENRLKIEDTPFERLLLAEANDRLSKPALVAEQVRDGLKRYPDDLLLNLAEVALLMRRSDVEAQKQAEAALARAQALYAKLPDEGKKANRTNMNLTQSAYIALHGKAAVAKQVLHSILTEDEDNKHAKKLLEAMGE